MVRDSSPKVDMVVIVDCSPHECHEPDTCISIRHSPQFFPIYAQRCQQPERHRNERPSILWGCQDLLQQHLCRQQSLASLDVWEIRLPWNGPSVENQRRKKRNGVRNRSSAKSGTGLNQSCHFRICRLRDCSRKPTWTFPLLSFWQTMRMVYV